MLFALRLTFYFFGLLKAECFYVIDYSGRCEVEQPVSGYIQFCHFEHIDLSNGLIPPFEIRRKVA